MLQFFYKVYADKIGHQKPLRRHFSNKQKMRCAAIANNIQQKIKKLYWHVHFKYVANQISLNVTTGGVVCPSAKLFSTGGDRMSQPMVCKCKHSQEITDIGLTQFLNVFFDERMIWKKGVTLRRQNLCASTNTIWRHLTLHHLLLRCCKPPFYEHENGPSLIPSIAFPPPLVSY